MNELQINRRVSYTDEYQTRVGTVIEINPEKTRARIKWDGRRLRTWIRIQALTILKDGVDR